MGTTVFNCQDDQLTHEAFRVFALRHGHVSRLDSKGVVDLPKEVVKLDDFKPYILQSKPKFEPKDRVVIVWTGDNDFEIYALSTYDFLGEMRVEYRARQKKSDYIAIYKGLRDVDDCIHFYRKTEHGKLPQSRYFNLA